MIEKEIARLLADVKGNLKLKAELLATKNSTDPLRDFCALCEENGYNIKVGELVALGQTMNDAKMRAVNGGGAWEIEGWDDAYEDLMMQIQWL